MKHTIADYRRCADSGMTIRQAADALGVSHQAIGNAITRHGIKFSAAYPDGVKNTRAPAFSCAPSAIARALAKDGVRA